MSFMTSRYLRQEVLKEIGKGGQHKIKSSSVAIVGVGALGTMSGELLVRAGVGKLLLIDGDVVSFVNLQRQLYSEKDVEKKKVVVFKEHLQEVNGDVSIDLIDDFLDSENVDIFLDGYDLILDCSDNMKTRHIINDYCQRFGKIWIYAAASGTKGNVFVVDKPETFRKYFNSGENFDTCEEIGVVNSLTVIIASLQVTEALKIIVGEDYCKDLIRFDVWNNKYEKIKIK